MKIKTTSTTSAPGSALLRVAGLMIAGATLTLSGCTVIQRSPRAYQQTPQCHSSQYWDGKTCRHKGQGHGARKHDGGGKPGGGGKKPK
jgi:hypothetical protein